MSGTTKDQFLGGKLSILQPKKGYRAATDPVFLAAATPIKPGQSVLEIGCGVGVALACLCTRVSEIDATGLEIQTEYAELARLNAQTNGLRFSVIDGDIAVPPDSIKARNFDHVIMNPPFFEIGKFSPPLDAGKTVAHQEGPGDLDIWIQCGIRRLRPGGWLTIIHLADRLGDILSACQKTSGNIHILPLVSRSGRVAKRIIILCQKNARAPLQLHSPFVIHAGTEHQAGASDYSNLAQSILRHGSALKIIDQ